MNNVILNPLERNELIKAMMGRGIDYETAEAVLRDFDVRTQYMYQSIFGDKTLVW